MTSLTCLPRQTALDRERRAELDYILFRGGHVRAQVKAEQLEDGDRRDQGEEEVRSWICIFLNYFTLKLFQNYSETNLRRRPVIPNQVAVS